MKKPTKPEDIISFLGLTGYYKRFIKGYDYLVRPLRLLTHGNVKWDFCENKEAQKAYEILIDSLCSHPILKLPNLDKDFIVKSDVSGYAWGAALVQEYDGMEFPVSYASGTLNSSQRNWPAWKREMYGSMRAIQKWHHYLLGRKFKLITDHRANVYLMDPLKKHPPIINNWKIFLSQYDYDVEHRPGKELIIEDWLSRSPNLLLLELDDIIKQQKEDELLKQIIPYVISSTNFSDIIFRLIKCNVDQFIYENDTLFYLETNSKYESRRVKRVALPVACQEEVFKNSHDHPLSGHNSFEKFFQKVSHQYWYPNLYTLILNYYEKCETCLKNKIIKTHNSNIKPIIATDFAKILEIDHIIVNIETDRGNKYILVVTDVFTKKSWFIPSMTLGAVETFQLLMEHVFSPFFFCKNFVTDHGTSFENDLGEALCKATGMKHKFALPYHKGATGQVENRNKSAETYIRKYVDKFNQKNWDDYCWPATYAYNKNMSSVHKFSPDYLVFLKEPFTLIDLTSLGAVKSLDEHVEYFKQDAAKAWKIAQELIHEQVKNMTKYRDNYLHNRDVCKIKLNDLVLLKNQHHWVDKSLNFKLCDRNLGPYSVVNTEEEVNHLTLQITPSKTHACHYDDVTLYTGIERPFQDGYFTPDLTEVIPKKIPIRKAKQGERILGENSKNRFNVKSIVGRRVSVLWPSNKRTYKGTVIGYSTNLQQNLIFYDEPTKGDNTIESEDYYKCKLFPSNSSTHVDEWNLLSM
jgi:Integrase core domain.